MSGKLILMIGESGSGKSTVAQKLVDSDPNIYVRLERDLLRVELHSSFDHTVKNANRAYENHVGKTQFERALACLENDQIPVISDTNLNVNTQEKWKNFCLAHDAEIEIKRVTTDLATCIERDSKRSGKARVGRAVIGRQFLESGRLQTLIDAANTGKKVVIVDLDGTVADMTGVRGPFDEHLVHLDKYYSVIVDWVNALAKDNIILIVSGRHSTCGDASSQWLVDGGVIFEHIFMRHAWDSRSDVIVKQEILDAILKYIPKEQILCVLDDRPKVVNGVWKANGITCYPVRGTTDHTSDCPYFETKSKHSCDHCGALGDF